jgi:tetraprenyl-beta-curcumene synthase
VASTAVIPPPYARGDPAPWSSGQTRALVRAVGRELGWGLPRVRREVSAWRVRAAHIPDPEVRAAALDALARKRSYLDGAALFSILPDRRDPRLLGLLVGFQIAADFLDDASERGVSARGRSGGSLMAAFADAVDLEALPVGAYYEDHPWTDDGGYLRDLVASSRAACSELPGYGPTRELLVHEARRARALELVHEPDPDRRDDQLRRLARDEGPGRPDDAWWFETAAGSASALPVIVLLALAADPQATDADRRAAAQAYRWVGALSTMLDGYVDQVEDRALGRWNAIARYRSATDATDRIGDLIDRSLSGVGRLRNGPRHIVIVSSMIALFLSHDSAREPDRVASTDALIAAGGSLTRRLVPALRMWRTALGQRAT